MYLYVLLLTVVLILLIWLKRKRLLLPLRILVVGCLILLVSEPLLYRTFVRTYPIFVLVDNSRSMRLWQPEIDSLLQFIKSNHPKYKIYIFPEADSLTFTADSSPIVDYLTKVSRTASAIILVSDGNETATRLSWTDLHSITVPVYPVNLPDKVWADVGLIDMIVREPIYSHDSVSVILAIRNDTLPIMSGLTFLKDGEPIFNKTLHLGSGINELNLKLKFDHPGIHSLQASMDVPEWDINPFNNQLTVQIRVLAPKRVIWIGKPSWNFKFLKQSVDNKKGIVLDYYLEIAPGVYWTPAGKITQLPDSWPSADIVVLDNYSVRNVPATQTLVMIGGIQHRLSPLIPPCSYRSGTFYPNFKSVTLQGLQDTVLVFHELYVFNGLKEGAQVWATLSPKVQHLGHIELPLIVWQPYTHPKVLHIAVNDIWGWDFVTSGKFSKLLFEYLLYGVDYPYVQFMTPLHVQEGIVQRIDFMIWLTPDERYEDTILVRLNNIEHKLYPTDDVYHLYVNALTKGKHHMRVEFGNRIWTDTLLVEPLPIEDRLYGVDRFTLQQIADATGGTIIDSIAQLSEVKPTSIQRPVFFSQSLWFLLPFFALFVITWLLEKR